MKPDTTLEEMFELKDELMEVLDGKRASIGVAALSFALAECIFNTCEKEYLGEALDFADLQLREACKIIEKNAKDFSFASIN